MKKTIVSFLIMMIILIYPASNVFKMAEQSSEASPQRRTQTDILKKLSDADIRDIQKKISQVKENSSQDSAEKDPVKMILQQLDSGEITYRNLFKDVYIAGDSLMNGLESYNILNSNNLFTQVSASLYHLSDNSSKIIGVNPEVLILHYGLNMLETDSGQPERFVSFYKKLIAELKEALPDTKIIVSGLFPVDTDIVKAKRFGRIDEYNQALQAMCDELSVEFLDNSTVLPENADFYASDGIHLNKSFYQDYWLRYILTEKEII